MSEEVTTETTHSSRGLPRCQDPSNGGDSNHDTVEYNEDLLRFWDGHIHVKFCHTANVIFYVYKYIFKGRDGNRFHLGEAESVDEISEYLDCRY